MDDISLDWSATYAVLAPLTNAQKATLHGDKILLPQSALEQLLSAARRAPDPGSASSLYPAGFGGNHGNSARGGEQARQLPQPLTFRLANRRNGRAVYAGVREFSAPEGAVLLSPYLLDALDIKKEDLLGGQADEHPIDYSDEAIGRIPQVSVRAKQLPKGEFVRLRPLESGYNDDWKPLLEREFGRSFTTLTKNATVSVQGPRSDGYRFLVDRILPDDHDAICVVDTDLEVDIEAMDEEQARETVRKMLETKTGGEIDIWKAVQGEVARGGYAEFKLPSWQRESELMVELSGLGDDSELDLFVSPLSARNRSRPRDDDHVFGNFEPPRDGVKAISVSPSNVALEGAESLLIAVRAYQQRPREPADEKDLVSFTLRAKSTPKDADTSLRDKAAGPGEDSRHLDDSTSSENEQCTNCHQWIPKRTMVLHENFCRRNNISCQLCGAVFKKGSEEYESHWHCPQDDASGSSMGSKAKHDDVYHAERQCPCGYVASSLPDLAGHRTTVCPEKLILCRFCHLEVPQEGDPSNPSSIAVLKGLTEHELVEGGKTEDCHLCGQRVRLIDMAAHLAIHELDKTQRPAPKLCQNINCGRTAYGVGPRGEIYGPAKPGTAARLELCQQCSGPLYASVHDPDGKALRRRIERRYLQQLMVGCGKPYCSNRYCRKGRASMELPDLGKSTKDVLPVTKELLEKLGPGMRGELSFCVDETSAKQRAVADMVASGGVWSLAWCMAASEGAGDLSRIGEWLENWAPKEVG